MKNIILLVLRVSSFVWFHWCYLDGVSGRHLIQGHGSVQLPLIQFPHVDIIQLLEVGGHQQAVV